MSNFYHPLVKPQIVVPHKIVGIPVNSGISLKCRIEASPKPITVWSRKKGLLYNYTIFLRVIFKKITQIIFEYE